MGGIVELARFPIRHPDAAVRRRHPWQIALVQPKARRKLEEERHRRADELGVSRLRSAPDILVGAVDVPRSVAIGTIDAGALIQVFADDAEMSYRRAMSLASIRNSGGRDQHPAAIEI